MTIHNFFRACCVGVLSAWLFTPTIAYADPITAAVFGAAFAQTFGGMVVSFIISTAISPGAMFSGDIECDALSSKPPRLNAITPIGKGGRSIGPFMIARTTGECMVPAVGDMTYLLMDKRLTIRRNDLVTMALHGGPMAGAVITKRFVEAYTGIVSVAQSSPRMRLDFEAQEIEWAYRVRAVSTSLVGALWLMLVATVRPRSLNERLGAE
ncbi:hypothetical protein [Sphingomonas sp. VDB2]|uniref:hypothetical protein n=1 Tax=Sphingomonas sp. VDB2 TaxID=3228751 RepID=UPI003A7FD8E5